MKNLLQERLLLYRVQTKKEPEAFAGLYDAYVGQIYRFVYFKLSHKEESEDITATVFLKCWQYLIGDEGKKVRHFSALLYTIARNEIIEVYRRRARKPERVIEEDDQEIRNRENLEAMVDVREEYKQLLRSIKKLKQEYQEVIVFRYIEELSISEISAMIGKSQTAVRVTLHRALKKLKELTEDIAI